jgi:serine/threonine-protein kinase RIO1
MGAPDEPRCQSEWRLRAKALIARLTAELSEDATVEERRKTLWAKVGQRIMALFGAGRYGAKRCANTLHAMATSAPIQPTRSFNGRTMSTSRSGRAAKMRKAPTIEFRTIDAAAKSGASFLVKRGQDMALARWAATRGSIRRRLAARSISSPRPITTQAGVAPGRWSVAKARAHPDQLGFAFTAPVPATGAAALAGRARCA